MKLNDNFKNTRTTHRSQEVHMKVKLVNKIICALGIVTKTKAGNSSTTFLSLAPTVILGSARLRRMLAENCCHLVLNDNH